MAVKEQTLFYKGLKESKKISFVEKKAKDIHLTKQVNGKPVTAILRALPNGKYNLTPGKYLFKSGRSNFDYGADEHRNCRDEKFIFAIIDEIERLEFGHLINNKSTWICVNKNNNRSNKTKLKRKLARRFRI